MTNKLKNKLLLTATREGDLEQVTQLLKSGADINAKGYYNCTPLHLASYWGHLPVVQYLVKQGADINARNNDNEPPLHLASERGHLEIAQYLMEEGADFVPPQTVPYHQAMLSFSHEFTLNKKKSCKRWVFIQHASGLKLMIDTLPRADGSQMVKDLNTGKTTAEGPIYRKVFKKFVKNSVSYPLPC